ncbi:MAG: hypothetical protein ACFNYD_04325, partial [Bacteroides sp.]
VSAKVMQTALAVRDTVMTIAPPALTLVPPYLRRICALPTSYLLRFMFGFRLKAKPEDAVELVLCWYGEGTELVRCWWYT